MSPCSLQTHNTLDLISRIDAVHRAGSLARRRKVQLDRMQEGPDAGRGQCLMRAFPLHARIAAQADSSDAGTTAPRALPPAPRDTPLTTSLTDNGDAP